MLLLECDFVWNSQNIANLFFCFEDGAPDTQQTDQTGANHGQENREKEEQKTEVRC